MFIRARKRIGPYWRLAAIGRGGMADVYLVAVESPLGLEQLQVIKQPLRTLLEDPDFVDMFLDEGRLGTRLSHPNIVSTVEVAIYDEQPTIVMEYVEGRSLHRLLHELRDSDRRPAFGFWLHLIAQLLQGLSYAHELVDFDGMPLRVVHRDVTPGNVLISNAGEVKLCDFGIARAARRASHTRTGMIKGKSRYMAPEQLAGGQVDQRSDLFSVGVLLWECVANKSPWLKPLTASDDYQVPRLSEANPSVPEELDDLCARALAFRKEDRFQSAREMLDAVEETMARLSRWPSRREVRRLMEELFGEEQEDIRNTIRGRLAELSGSDSEQASAASQSLPRIAASLAPPEPTSVSLTPSGEPAPRLSSSLFSFFAAASVFVLLLLGGFAVTRHQAPTAIEPAAPAPASNGASKSAAASPVMAELYVVVVPREAVISIDGRELEGNPVTIALEAGGKEHLVRATAEGHEAKTTAVRLAEDSVVQLRLDPTGTAEEAPGKPPEQPQPRSPTSARPEPR